MRKIWIVLVCMSMLSVLYAVKPVSLQGRLAFANRGVVRIYVYQDRISYQKQEIQHAEVDEDGHFSMQLQLQETTPIEIAYNNTYGSLIVEPGHSYNINITTDSALIGRIDADMLGNYLHIQFVHIDTAELNCKIWRFNKYYNYFLDTFGDALLRGVEETVYDSLLQLLKTRFPDEYIPTNYYSAYIHYRYADLDLLYYSKEKEKVYQQYLSGEYVHYNNIAYMDFFHHFFENHIYGASKYIAVSTLHDDINKKRNYYKLFDDMGADPLLVNEIIREMVIILGLGELYDNDEFNNYNILHLLQQLKACTKFEEHKLMADNMIAACTTLRTGSRAPDFCLRDVYNNEVHLHDFKGKYVYMQLFATYSASSIREMLILKDLYRQYKDSLEVVSVMLDFEYSKLYHFVSEFQEFDWTFLHCNGDFSFIDAYKAYALPLGVLIDSEGKIVSYPAKSPSEGLLMQIFTIFPALGEKNRR